MFWIRNFPSQWTCQDLNLGLSISATKLCYQATPSLVCRKFPLNGRLDSPSIGWILNSLPACQNPQMWVTQDFLPQAQIQGSNGWNISLRIGQCGLKASLHYTWTISALHVPNAWNRRLNKTLFAGKYSHTFEEQPSLFCSSSLFISLLFHCAI